MHPPAPSIIQNWTARDPSPPESPLSPPYPPDSPLTSLWLLGSPTDSPLSSLCPSSAFIDSPLAPPPLPSPSPLTTLQTWPTATLLARDCPPPALPLSPLMGNNSIMTPWIRSGCGLIAILWFPLPLSTTILKMQDPSHGVQRDLIPHVHLLSTYRFPSLPTLPPDKAAEWLLNAPKIARDASAFHWTYIDKPLDGTVLLTWQSLNTVGTEFPSDGYIWAPIETAFQMEIAGGYTLEVYSYKTGYAPGEALAMHCRRRFRLLPSKFPNPNAPSPDPSFWITHYGQSMPDDRVPSNAIPINANIQNIMNTRSYLQQQGQLVHKEFMLHDRANWPQIQFPRSAVRGPQMYSNMPPARIPQNMAYPPQAIAPPAKRVRTQANPAQAIVNSAVAALEDDDEDTSRGDVFDYVTPREISVARYKQNHEWMEEIMSSPYAINQLIPADLGLGLRGELSGLTAGIFDAHLNPEGIYEGTPNDPTDPRAQNPMNNQKKDVIEHSYIGRLDASKANEFRQRVADQLTRANKEIEKMKAKHAKRLAKFKKGSIVTVAEKELRAAVDNPSDTGPEYWRLEGRIDNDDDDDGKAIHKTPLKVDDILAQVEASLGRHTAAVHELRRIQDGGYEEAIALSSPRISRQPSHAGSHQSGIMIGEADVDMGGSAAGLLDQYHSGLSPNPTTSNFPTPQAHLHGNSGSGTPSHLQAPSPQPQSTRDINMADPGISNEQPSATDSTGDWVVIPPGGVSPANSTSTTKSAQGPTANDPSTELSDPQAQDQNEPVPDFPTNDSTDFPDLADLDSAAEALAGYGDNGEGDLDLGLDMDVAMDDSAFGDAFHGVESAGADESGD
ncbi:hypothetical protein B7494_g1738 [Chlorociboria aeruginascens]|nr:hypothetical protein B7494_g1738 [Chlorociboria aeruginascens]